MRNGFTGILLKWNETENNRSMPWKGEKDPYKIWLSEIILQQTRVEQGLAYYERFIAAFPTVMHLAKAPEQQVFKLWEGLGYYTRCKNLIASAQVICNEYGGKFPNTYETIKSLKGIGDYTAAAIASFAFGLPYAVVDGNVFRVLSRFLGIDTPIDTTEGKKKFKALAAEMLDKKQPALYNQAIMDFGATVCKPQMPLCDSCPLQKQCAAFNLGKVNSLPVKTKSIARKTRFFHYFMIEYNGSIYVKKRTGSDIWQNLYEFVLHESLHEKLDEHAVRLFVEEMIRQKKFEIISIQKGVKQQLTHQTIYGEMAYIKIKKPAISLSAQYELLTKNSLKQLPFPKLINSLLKQLPV